MSYYLSKTPKDKNENYERVQSLGKVLLDNCKEALKVDPVYKNSELECFFLFTILKR
jgi:fatty acid synthase subunit alpha